MNAQSSIVVGDQPATRRARTAPRAFIPPAEWSELWREYEIWLDEQEKSRDH